MNDPAPAFGRGGWVCVALLLGLFAGGGLTWAVLSRRVLKAPLVVYPVPPPGAILEAIPGAAGSGPGPTPGSPALPLEDATNATPGADGSPRLLPPASREDEAVPAVVDWESPAGRQPLPSLRLSGDRLLRNHPKAEGCLANALAALAPLVKKGFILRDKVWDGEISLDEGKAVACQLFKGNDYCFCVGTDAKGAKLSLQLYGDDGASVDAEQSGQELAAGASATACLRCRQTGTYFVVVKLEASTQEKVSWGMVSAYR